MDDDRTERVSASLEAQFDTCVKQVDGYLSRVRDDEGVISPGCFDTYLKLVRMNAQLAGTIARLDNVKNRNSKTQ
jgi:hypothetical protein